MVYLDTSVVVSLLIPEPRTADVMHWFSALGKTPVSGDWLLTEFASAISIKQRSGELTGRDADLIRKEFHLLATSGLRLLPVSRAVFGKAADLAQQRTSGLRAGDALHLATASEAGVKALATLDTIMAANATRMGIAVERI